MCDSKHHLFPMQANKFVLPDISDEETEVI